MCLKNTRFCSFLIIGLIIIFASFPCYAKNKTTKELQTAQSYLSKGEYDKAYALYHQVAVKKKNPLAQFTLGLFFHLGWGRPVDQFQACKWFEKAADNNIPAAAQFFADCLKNGGKGIPKDPGKAAKLYQKAADLGIKSALCSLGELYVTGNGVPKDVQKGISLCEQAGKAGVVPAQVRLGHLLKEKDTGFQDLGRSFYWFSIAAQANVPEAQYYLGIMFKDGMGIAKDMQSARLWLERAASLGYQSAYLPVGLLYFNSPEDPETGKLSAHDLAKSYLWLSAALRQISDAEASKKAGMILTQVGQIMPETWKSDLDAKVDAHFKSFPSDKP